MRSLDNQKWLPWVVGIVSLTVVLTLWYSLLKEERADIDRLAEMVAVEVSADYAEHLNSQVLALIRMARRWRYQKDSHRTIWEDDAEQYIKHYPGYKSILIVDPSYNVKWSVSLKKDSLFARNISLRPHHELIMTMMEARERREVVMSNPFDIQGNRVFSVSVPLFRSRELDGFVIGIFDVDELFYYIWSRGNKSGYTIDVFSGGVKVFSSNSAEDRLGDDWSKEVELSLYTASWQFKLSLMPETLSKIRTSIPFVGLVGGVLVSVSLTFAIYFAQTAQIRYNELKLINRELQEEIVARNKAETELNKSREQLRSLAMSEQRVREEERIRIARNIHDDLGQILTIFQLDLAWIKKRLGSDQEPLKDKIKRTAELVDSAMTTVQRISSELRPTVLDDLGIAAGIRWQAEEFQSRTGIKCKLEVEPDEINLDPELSTNVFRVFQEMLTNVARHAKATRVDVVMKVSDEKLYLEVADDGKGISENEIFDPKSIGLMGIRERLYPFHGIVEITGIQGSGTTVRILVPLGTRRSDA